MNYFIRLIILAVLSVNTAIATQSLIELDHTQVRYHTGNDVKYFGEYKPKDKNDFTLFPLKSCDPVPIDSIGDLKVFFTSAIEGHVPLVGQGIVIPRAESITKVLAVRGKSESSRNRVEVYIGYDPSVFEVEKTSGSKIYQAVLLALQVKSTRSVDQRTVNLFSQARYLDNMKVFQEIRKLNPLAGDATGEVCQNMLRELMPKRSTFTFAGGYRQDVPGLLSKPGLLDGNFYSATCYWTKDGDNLLKGTKYRKKD